MFPAAPVAWGLHEFLNVTHSGCQWQRDKQKPWMRADWMSIINLALYAVPGGRIYISQVESEERQCKETEIKHTDIYLWFIF